MLVAAAVGAARRHVADLARRSPGSRRRSSGSSADAVKAVAGGAEILVIGDRRVGPGRAPVPALLAVAAVHHELVRAGLRTRCSLVVDSGEPREVHHVACLVGYGADAVHGWLAGDGSCPALGTGLRGLAREVLMRHARTYEPVGGLYRWRKGGERRSWNPDSVAGRRRARGRSC